MLSRSCNSCIKPQRNKKRHWKNYKNETLWLEKKLRKVM